MKLLFSHSSLYVLLAFMPLQAWAQQALVVAPSADIRSNISIGEEQMSMLKAAQYVIEQKFGEAEVIYSSVISNNPKNLQAYIQRSIARRELGNKRGMETDAVEVINISQIEMQQRPDDASLYYSRGTAYRLLRDYAKARADIEYALRLSPENAGWKQDLQAIALEEKML